MRILQFNDRPITVLNTTEAHTEKNDSRLKTER